VLYDSIGKQYRQRRTTDPRIASAILRALEDADTLVNVGAGTGSYEPAGTVVAVEPSMTMIRQRLPGAAPVIQGQAERLPLRDKCVSAALAVLTVHHWRDVPRGLDELARVARDRVVILTYDPSGPGFWLTEEYFSAIAAQDRLRFPRVDDIARALGHACVQAVPVPRDCVDGFLGAYWARPEAYLDPAARSAMSGFANLPELEAGLLRLQRDLATGVWQDRFGALTEEAQLDIGYRLVVAAMQ
jgi:SAM-dependent methyltransferase